MYSNKIQLLKIQDVKKLFVTTSYTYKLYKNIIIKLCILKPNIYTLESRHSSLTKQ